MTGAPPSHPIERATPTDIAALKNCQLQYAIWKAIDYSGPARPPSPAARLGRIAHRSLESVVATRGLFTTDSESTIEDAWTAELQKDQEQFALAEEPDRWGPPESWNNYYLVRAQLTVAAGMLRATLEPVDIGAEYLIETPLVDDDTVLWGIPDLVVRSPGLHALIDYKTGGARGPNMGVRESYETQMHIYAYLEFKRSGAWPERSLILSFQDGLFEIATGASTSMAYVEDALDRIASYNQCAPRTPSASPSVDACGFCSYIPRCEPFWEEAQGLASEGLVAVRGATTRVTSTPFGGYAIKIQPIGETPFKDQITIRRIDPKVHNVASHLQVGDVICATRIFAVADEEEDGSEWRLGRFGELSLIHDDADGLEHSMPAPS